MVNRFQVVAALSITLAALLSLLDSSSKAYGGLVTFEWQGTVTDVGGFGGTSTGDAISGQYTFDLNTPDIQPTPETGIYDSAVKDWNAGFGGSTWSGDDMDISIVDWSFDQYQVAINSGTAIVNGPVLEGFSLANVIFQLRNNNTTTGFVDAITSIALSATPPTLTDFESREVTFHFGDGNGNSRIVVGSIDQLTATSAVPEPATFALFGLGAAGLAVFRRRNRRPSWT